MRTALLLVSTILAMPAPAQRAECHGAAAGSDPRVAAGQLTEAVVAQLAGTTGARRRPVSTPGESALIDDEIFGAMRAANVRSAPPATDEEFLRRVTIDLTGQIPTIEDVESFTADPRANKRALLVERLLASDAFVDRWTLFLGDLFRNTTQPFVGGVFAPFRNQLHDSLRAAVRDGKPYDQLARELITATGHGAETPAVNFLIRDFLYGDDPVQDMWDNLAVSTHRAFLGVNLFCISCHNGAGHTTAMSPWLTTKRREEFWESAAFFSRVRIAPAASNSNYDAPFQLSDVDGEYRLGTTNGNKTPRSPEYAGGRQVIDPAFILTGEKPAAGENPRAALARMITSHPQFARATVNYLWKEMFVLGIVEPANAFDMLRQNPATTPGGWSTQPTHPRLLALLGDYFVKSGYDLRAVLRLMANSKAYQLSSTYPAGQWRAEYARYFARRFARRLRSEEVLDAVSAATGVWEPIRVADGQGRFRTVVRAGELPDVAEPLQDFGPDVRPFLDAFLRGNRNDTPRSDELALSQSLMMMNSPVVVRRVEAPSSRARELLASGAPPAEIVRRLYLATLGRTPSAAESAAAVAMLDGGTQAVEDLQYALVNKLEFVFNH